MRRALPHLKALAILPATHALCKARSIQRRNNANKWLTLCLSLTVNYRIFAVRPGLEPVDTDVKNSDMITIEIVVLYIYIYLVYI